MRLLGKAINGVRWDRERYDGTWAWSRRSMKWGNFYFLWGLWPGLIRDSPRCCLYALERKCIIFVPYWLLTFWSVKILCYYSSVSLVIWRRLAVLLQSPCPQMKTTSDRPTLPTYCQHPLLQRWSISHVNSPIYACVSRQEIHTKVTLPAG